MKLFADLISQLVIILADDGRFHVELKGKKYAVLVGMARATGYYSSNSELDCGRYLNFSLQERASIISAADGRTKNRYSVILLKRAHECELAEAINGI